MQEAFRPIKLNSQLKVSVNPILQIAFDGKSKQAKEVGNKFLIFNNTSISQACTVEEHKKINTKYPVGLVN